MAEKITNATLEMLNEAVKQTGMQDMEEITSENMTKLLALPQEQLNAVIHNLYLIAEQRGFSNLMSPAENPFREFLFDMKNNGWTIQDYMLNILDGQTPYWDDSYTDAQVAEGLVKEYEQKVSESFHTTPYSKQFITTINEKDLAKYFYPYAFQSFVDNKISNLSSSAEVWLEKSVLIDEIKTMVYNRDIVTKTDYDPNSDTGIKHLIEDLKATYTGFLQPTDLYNKDGVVSITQNKDFIYIVMKPSTMERLKVYVNSGVFNLDEIALHGRIIYVPEDMDLGTDSDGNPVLAIMLDRRAIVLGLRTYRVTDFFIANKLRRNYFLSIEGLRGHNTFINAVAFSGTAIGNFQ